MTTTIETGALVINRTFNAPLDTVWEAWTNEQHLLEWWGPHSFPAVEWKHDFREGGDFKFVMEGPGGMKAPAHGTYETIEPKTKIVQLGIVPKENGDVWFKTRQTFTFTDNGDGTTSFDMNIDVLVDDDFPGRQGMEQGWNEQLDKGAEYFAELA